MAANPRLDIEGLSPQQIEAQFCCVHAFGITDAADLLSEHTQEQKPIIPAAVLLRAFAVELMIKSGLIAQSGSCPRTHDLSDLFRTLKDDLRSHSSHLFEESTKCDREPFVCLDQFLFAHQNSFLDWRYLHEAKSLEAAPDNLRSAFVAIYGALALRYPELLRANPSAR